MKKYVWQILMAAVLSVILFSCSGSLRTGNYVVDEVYGRTVHLKKPNGKKVLEPVYFPTDTLKKGDVVRVTKVRRESQANIW